ncbi:hypothetical protein T484DRAFT_1885935 [Baffinella frigidus]|nr:hypothetical protein T484DRAFT_1885935 [Cryptophyta sp. CCMP2293]
MPHRLESSGTVQAAPGASRRMSEEMGGQAAQNSEAPESLERGQTERKIDDAAVPERPAMIWTSHPLRTEPLRQPKIRPPKHKDRQKTGGTQPGDEQEAESASYSSLSEDDGEHPSTPAGLEATHKMDRGRAKLLLAEQKMARTKAADDALQLAEQKMARIKTADDVKMAKTKAADDAELDRC